MDQRVRFEMLVGKEGLDRLRKARVAVFGLGGVGGYVAEALARAGVGTLDLIDNDRVELSNLNRQIIALHSTIGQTKVEAAAARVRDIDPTIHLNLYQCFYLPETRDQFDFKAYDYVVDCIDTVTGKLDLVMQCRAAGTPIICALGTGNKLDPSKLLISDLSETSVCPLARVMRKELRRRGVEHLKVLWSREEPRTPLFQPGPESAEPVDCAKTAKPVEDPESAEPVEGAESAKPVDGGKIVKPVEVAETAKPADGAKTAEAAGPEAYGNKRRSVPGSSPFVPPAAGLLIASAVVRDLLNCTNAP